MAPRLKSRGPIEAGQADPGSQPDLPAQGDVVCEGCDKVFFAPDCSETGDKRRDFRSTATSKSRLGYAALGALGVLAANAFIGDFATVSAIAFLLCLAMRRG